MNYEEYTTYSSGAGINVSTLFLVCVIVLLVLTTVIVIIPLSQMPVRQDPRHLR